MVGRELVIAHYDGELDWIAEVRDVFDHITVYHKGPGSLSSALIDEVVVLPNVGREAHTYLTHITRRYSDLADRTVFSQDGYRDKLRWTHFQRICRGEALVNHRSVDVPWHHSIVQHWPSYKGVPMIPVGISQREFFDRYIFTEPGQQTCDWLNGAYVTATKEEILHRSLPEYARILDETGLSEHINPEAAYLMERAWYSLWKKPSRECTFVHVYS